MASIKTDSRSANWIACYRDVAGIRRQTSTGTSDRREAQRIADDYELSARNKKTEVQVRKVLSDISERINGAALLDFSCIAWLDQWLVRVAPEVKANTFTRYKDAVALAMKFAPEMCEKSLARVSPKDVYAFRAALHAQRSAGTTNQTLKILRMALKAAGPLLLQNPAAGVKPVRPGEGEATSPGKRPFTADQLRALMGAADDEDRGLILAGLYTAGQRLGDVVTLTVGQIDFAEGLVRFSGANATGKTGRTVLTPIVADWMADLEARAKGKPPGAALFPRANKRWVDAGCRPGRVSNCFRTLLARVGLAPKANRKRKGAVAGRRQPLPYSFHSFRHTATSLMANSGVSKTIAMDLVGHESAAVSEHYTHVENATKRAAMETATKGLRLTAKPKRAA